MLLYKNYHTYQVVNIESASKGLLFDYFKGRENSDTKPIKLTLDNMQPQKKGSERSAHHKMVSCWRHHTSIKWALKMSETR